MLFGIFACLKIFVIDEKLNNSDNIVIGYVLAQINANLFTNLRKKFDRTSNLIHQ